MLELDRLKAGAVGAVGGAGAVALVALLRYGTFDEAQLIRAGVIGAVAAYLLRHRKPVGDDPGLPIDQ